MAFKVFIAPAALLDLSEATQHIAHESGIERAIHWRQGALATIRSLTDAPQSFALVPEAGRLGVEYRQAHYYSHQIIFEVDEASQIVVVARVYHGARRPLRTSDLD